MDELKHEDAVQDQEQIEENLDPVEEQLESHEDSDAGKWDKVFSMLDKLNERMDRYEEWANERFKGIDKTEEETADAVDEGSTDYPAADADQEFYERQKQYLAEGGY